MWLTIIRTERPDADQWPGRRVLASIDALIWPLLWVWMIRRAEVPTGVVGPFVASVAVLCALTRLHRALWMNHRYWFTTWRWGRVVGALLLLGALMKIMTAA
ncbi:MAG: hypothetical protein EOO80_01690 [Oxalobacteraceae bacterium]|nr:MAG: hypothetical protein EOO80_01690 [Oxalobacteraceae bacterium]